MSAGHVSIALSDLSPPPEQRSRTNTEDDLINNSATNVHDPNNSKKHSKKKHQSEYNKANKKKKTRYSTDFLKRHQSERPRTPPKGVSVRFHDAAATPTTPEPAECKTPSSSPPSDSKDPKMDDEEIHIPRNIKRDAGRMTYKQRNPDYPQLSKQPSEKQIPLQYRFTENFLGYKPKEYSSQPSLPEGYEVRHTKNGYIFLVPENEEAAPATRVWSAKFEHKRIDVSFSASREELGDIYGVGIYIFFDFLRYLTWGNVLLFIISMVHFVAHIVFDGSGYGTGSKFWYWLYIVNYSKDSKPYWLFGCAAAVLIWFLMGPYYSKRVTKYYVNNQIEDFDDGFRFDDAILSNEKYSHHGLRLVVSYIVFLLCVFGSAMTLYGVCKAQESSGIPSLVGSAVIALFISLVNLIYNFFAVLMTTFERHSSWSAFRAHNTFKYYMFKLLLAVAMYVIRYAFLPKSGSCQMGDIADQFLVLLVVDLIWGNLIDVAYVYVLWKYGKIKGEFSMKSNESAKPEFDVAEQYLQILYRQFVIFLGSTIFPWLPLLGVICHFVDYQVSKYILLKFCQQNYYLRGSMKKFLTFYLFFTAFMAVVCFPFGAAWVLSEFTHSVAGCLE